MGREVKRVPLDFEWPLKRAWFGYVVPSAPCQLCAGGGERRGGDSCPVCDGYGIVYWGRIEVPVGDGWQMWETTSEGSPISPVFATPEGLARWLADTGASAFGGTPATYEQWLGMVRVGWAPSAVADGSGLRSGVEFVGSPRPDADLP
jgi:hypothetical protein